MKERLEFNEEDLPRIKLRFDSDRSFDATPLNTTLFTHLGRLAMWDHVFMQTGEEDEMMVGSYVFRSADVFDELAAFIAENNYPMVLNKIEVSECDQVAFDRMLAQNSGDLDTIPDEWME